MKKSALLFILVITTLTAAACGAPTPAATPAPVQPATAAATAQPVPPTLAVPAGASTQVDITLSDNKIKSSLTTFQVGVPYTFVITNKGNHGHNFNINTPVSATGSLDAALSSALLVVTKDKLSSGASVTIEYTFPDSAAGALLEISCLIRKHYEDGMLLPITVTK